MSNHNSLVVITKKYLQLAGVRFSSKVLNETLSSHPNYPSLASLINFFKDFSIPIIHGKGSWENLLEIQQPILTYLSSNNGTFVIIKKIKNDFVTYYESNTGWNKMSKDNFITHWTNIILFIPIDELEDNQKNSYINRIRYSINYNKFIAYFLIIFLFVSILYNQLFYVIISLAMIGMTTSIYLTTDDLNLNSVFKNTICEYNTKFSCDSVLNSSGSKLFGVFKLTDICIIFFSAELLSLWFSFLSNTSTETSLTWCVISVLACPIIVYSIHYQKFIIKAWCPLCLMISAIIVIQAIIFFLNVATYPSIGKITTMSNITFNVILTTYIWFYLKTVLKEVFLNRIIINSYKKVIRSKSVIMTLLRKEKYVNLNLTKSDLIFGSENAEIVITTIISPFCKPCLYTHNEIEKFIKSVSIEVSHIIRFIKSDDVESINVSQHILAMKDCYSESSIHIAINDWFRMMNYEKWANIYPVELSYESAQALLNNFAWCEKNELNSTPTVIINNYIKPDILDINDLKYGYIDS